jgi:DNA-binding protein YbaB
MNKRNIEEAVIPLKPGEESVLRKYPALMPHVKQVLTLLRNKNPQATMQQAAQQMLATPHFKGNIQLQALAATNPQDVKSLSQVSNMLKPKITPPSILNKPTPPVYQNPEEWWKNQEIAKKHGVSPFHDEDQIKARVQAKQTGKEFKEEPQRNSGPFRRRTPIETEETLAKTQKIGEAINPTMLGPAMKKIFGVISNLKPEELQILLKMVNSMLGTGAVQGSQTSMNKTLVSSKQYKADKKILESIKKRIISESIKRQLNEQVKTYVLIENLLEAGALSSVWQGIKSAGSSFLDKMNGRDVAVATGRASAEDQAKNYTQRLSKMIKKANQTRQNFKGQVLKNAEIINQYHEAVAETWDSFLRVASSLGPQATQLKSQIEELVANLKYDLESEQEQIGSFLSVLKDLKNAPSSQPARATATQQRSEEAASSRRMKNPITGRSMKDSSVDPEIIKDTDKELVQQLVKTALGKDRKAAEQARNELWKIQGAKQKAINAQNKKRK